MELDSTGGAAAWLPSVRTRRQRTPDDRRRTGFSEAENWTGISFFGQRRTVFADVTGAGRAHAIAVDDAGIKVCRLFAGAPGALAEPRLGGPGRGSALLLSRACDSGGVPALGPA
jgi:hypothetical protein